MTAALTTLRSRRRPAKGVMTSTNVTDSIGVAGSTSVAPLRGLRGCSGLPGVIGARHVHATPST